MCPCLREPVHFCQTVRVPALADFSQKALCPACAWLEAAAAVAAVCKIRLDRVPACVESGVKPSRVSLDVAEEREGLPGLGSVAEGLLAVDRLFGFLSGLVETAEQPQ